MVGLIISKDQFFGLDIEKYDNKILNIKKKFLHQHDYNFLDNGDIVKSLTSIWCAKESIYKVLGNSSVFYSKNLYVVNKSKSKLILSFNDKNGVEEKFEAIYINNENFCICMLKFPCLKAVLGMGQKQLCKKKFVLAIFKKKLVPPFDIIMPEILIFWTFLYL